MGITVSESERRANPVGVPPARTFIVEDLDGLACEKCESIVEMGKVAIRAGGVTLCSWLCVDRARGIEPRAVGDAS